MTVDLLAIGAHPDDVEMTCAGLVVKMKKRGYTTGVVHLSRGEMGSRGAPEDREREAAASARVMGLDHMEFGGLPDGKLRRTDEAVDAVVAVIRRLRPRLVIAPYHTDPHPDHAHAGRIVTEAVHCAELKKYPVAGEPHFVMQLAYALHRFAFTPSFVVDITDEFETKKNAVLAYSSQVGPPQEGEQLTRLSSPDFLPGWEGRARFFGSMIGRPFGEPYLCEYPIPLDDPVAAFTVPQQRRLATR
jgi:bacillithiol biosynthesis deacetylase BshB1